MASEMQYEKTLQVAVHKIAIESKETSKLTN